MTKSILSILNSIRNIMKWSFKCQKYISFPSLHCPRLRNNISLFFFFFFLRLTFSSPLSGIKHRKRIKPSHIHLRGRRKRDRLEQEPGVDNGNSFSRFRVYCALETGTRTEKNDGEVNHWTVSGKRKAPKTSRN